MIQATGVRGPIYILEDLASYMNGTGRKVACALLSVCAISKVNN